MLNIEIPKSASQRSAEDRIAECVFKDIEKHGTGILSFFREGGSIGTFWNGERWEFVGIDAINVVADEFKKAGYIVQRRDYNDNMSRFLIR